MSDPEPGKSERKKPWHRPEIEKIHLTADELMRIDSADDPATEMHRMLRERRGQ